MYTHANHIPQPPHTSGQPFQGHRVAVDPSQVPSFSDTLHADCEQWENREFNALPGAHAPLSTTNFISVDQGNSSPKFVRLSTWSLPASASLAGECGIPLACMIQPLADLDPREKEVPVVYCGEEGPMRCERCKGYVNPWGRWVAGGRRWNCNLCRQDTDVPADYFSPLTANLTREDTDNRPEISKGTVEFVLPASCATYWAPPPPPRLFPPYHSVLPSKNQGEGRKPQQQDFVVVLDVSRDAIQSGFLLSVCDAWSRVLLGCSLCAADKVDKDGLGTDGDGTYSEDSVTWPRGSRIAFITFDRTLHFYHLGVSTSPPPVMIVPDIDEPFSPLLHGLFVDPYEAQARSQITSLLTTLPQRHEQTVVTDSCLGSAFRASLACLANCGGIILAFQSCLPRLGPGALTPSASSTTSALFNTDKEHTLYIPENRTWLDIGEEMVEEGAGVCLWVAGQREVGLGSIGVVPTLTGGDIFFHPRFKPATDFPVLHSQLQRVVSRTTGFNASLKIRCSPGLRIAPSSHRGSFLQRAAGEVEFGIITADHAISATIEHTQKLDERELAYLQVALLYTNMKGERRVRVCNVALQVVTLPRNVFDHADMETVLCYMAREAIFCRTTQPMNHIREDLTEQCSAILLGYRRNCGASTPQSHLLIPQAFHSLPVYTLATLKSKALKGRNVSPDVRNYYAHRLLSMSVRSTMHMLYPRLLALHTLSDDIALPDPVTGEITFPSLMRASHVFMTSDGVYLIDNEEVMIFWIGASVSPQILMDLFGVDDVMQVDPYLNKLPNTQTRLATQVRNIIAHRQTTRGRMPKLMIARQNIDAAEIEFSDMLVEDQNNASMSYIDYLCLIHKQINHALAHGGSMTGTTSFRGSPW